MLPTYSLTITYIMNVLETEKLILRNIQEVDFDDLYRMNSDPLIMKYVGDGSTRNHEQMTKELETLISPTLSSYNSTTSLGKINCSVTACRTCFQHTDISA